jgi:uncharacterized membrane protein YgdD (TMEM256/DUF423 family)
MNFSVIASLLLALAVAFGAFGAHALKTRLDAYSLGIWEKAVFYHFSHALGLLLVSTLGRAGMGTVCWLLVAGIVFFSGSLYLLALTGVSTLGAVTPIGGVAFIAAWILLAINFARR